MTWEQALKLELVQTQLHKAKTIAKVFAALNLDDVMALHLDGKRPAPESPIEVLFKLWWEVVSRADYWTPWDVCRLEPQVTVTLPEASYRLDFSVTCGDLVTREIADRTGVAFPLIGIELDGHDFHERTREQVTVRNKRDRDLQVAGWKVFHFSGSELVRDPQRCASDVWGYAIGVTSAFTIAALLSLDNQSVRASHTSRVAP